MPYLVLGRVGSLVAAVALLLAGACSGPVARDVPASGPSPVPSLRLIGSPLPSPITTPPPGSEKLVFRPESNQVRYRAHEMLLGRTFFSDAIGSTTASGQIFMTPNRTVISTALITIDLRTLKSDESERDAFLKTNTLEVDKFPEATFVPRAMRGLPDRLPDTRSVSFQLAGDLTIHGVTRIATLQVGADVQDDVISGTASTTIKLQDFGMEPPNVPVVVAVEDTVALEIVFSATREAV